MAGYPLRGSAESLSNGEVHYIQMRNVDPEHGIAWSDVAKLDLKVKHEQIYLKIGDIIFSARGSRNFAYQIEDVPQNTVCAPHFFIVRVHKPELLSPAFLAWQINQRPAQSYFQSTATGTHILNIRRDVLENLKIAIPPLAVQQKTIQFADAVRQERILTNQLLDNREKQMIALALGLTQNNEACTE